MRRVQQVLQASARIQIEIINPLKYAVVVLWTEFDGGIVLPTRGLPPLEK
jgi:hypothetical protein